MSREYQSRRRKLGEKRPLYFLRGAATAALLLQCSALAALPSSSYLYNNLGSAREQASQHKSSANQNLRKATSREESEWNAMLVRRQWDAKDNTVHKNSKWILSYYHMPFSTDTQRRTRKIDSHASSISLGWVPENYPNPEILPDQCGITPFLHSTTSTKHGRSNDEYMSDTEGKSMASLNESLLLCDPDRILSPSSLKIISSSLENFSAVYGTSRNGMGHGEAQDEIKEMNNFHEKGETKSRASSSEMNLVSESSLSRYNVSHGVLVESQMEDLPSLAGGSFAVVPQPLVQIGVAIVGKINVPAVIHESINYSFQYEDDVISDSAQYFASYLHSQWWGNQSNLNLTSNEYRESELQAENRRVNGVLIFISVQDRVCFISAGHNTSKVLPWWRLERVASSMQTNLKNGDFGDAILGAIKDLGLMLDEGPPSTNEKIHDFFSRFGVVLSFSLFTFLFACWGEIRDRQKRWLYTEKQSRLDPVDREKAKILQRGYKQRECPICLEGFSSCDINDEEGANGMKRVDSYGIPLSGSDGRPLKLLRCGHVYDESCWRCWVNSGHGNPLQCPVCRQDVGIPKKLSCRDAQAGYIRDGPEVPFNVAQSRPSYGTTLPTNLTSTGELSTDTFISDESEPSAVEFLHDYGDHF